MIGVDAVSGAVAVPVTHLVWVGLLLFSLGCAALVVRREVAGALSGLMTAAWGLALIFVAYARWWGNVEGHVLAVGVVALAAAAAAALVAIFARKGAS